MTPINFKLSNKDKVIIYSVLFVPVLVLIGFAIKGAFFGSLSPREYFLQDRINEEFQARVDSIYRQTHNHNIMTLQGKSGLFEVEGEWERKFKVGDSVSKQAGCLLVEHYRNGKLLEVLNYEDLRKQ